MNNHFYTQSIQNYTVWHTFIWHLAFCYWFGTVYCLTHVLASIKSSTLTLSAFLSPRSKRKTAWAINTKLGTHAVNGNRSACVDPEVERSKVKITRLSNALTAWVCRSIWLHWRRPPWDTGARAASPTIFSSLWNCTKSDGCNFTKVAPNMLQFVAAAAAVKWWLREHYFVSFLWDK